MPRFRQTRPAPAAGLMHSGRREARVVEAPAAPPSTPNVTTDPDPLTKRTPLSDWQPVPDPRPAGAAPEA